MSQIIENITLNDNCALRDICLKYNKDNKDKEDEVKIENEEKGELLELLEFCDKIRDEHWLSACQQDKDILGESVYSEIKMTLRRLSEKINALQNKKTDSLEKILSFAEFIKNKSNLKDEYNFYENKNNVHEKIIWILNALDANQKKDEKDLSEYKTPFNLFEGSEKYEKNIIKIIDFINLMFGDNSFNNKVSNKAICCLYERAYERFVLETRCLSLSEKDKYDMLNEHDLMWVKEYFFALYKHLYGIKNDKEYLVKESKETQESLIYALRNNNK